MRAVKREEQYRYLGHSAIQARTTEYSTKVGYESSSVRYSTPMPVSITLNNSSLSAPISGNLDIALYCTFTNIPIAKLEFLLFNFSATFSKETDTEYVKSKRRYPNFLKRGTSLSINEVTKPQNRRYLFSNLAQVRGG